MYKRHIKVQLKEDDRGEGWFIIGDPVLCPYHIPTLQSYVREVQFSLYCWSDPGFVPEGRQLGF